jgi:hypothetical protein
LQVQDRSRRREELHRYLFSAIVFLAGSGSRRLGRHCVSRIEIRRASGRKDCCRNDGNDADFLATVIFGMI